MSKAHTSEPDRPPMPAHQFDDVAQQHDADEFGMWLFLATEVLFFGGMFLGYGLYRLHDEAAFAEASKQLNIWLGTFNTTILLGSSLTMALAVHEAEQGNRKRLLIYLVATMLLGAAFLGVKGIEYTEKYHHGLIPITGLPFEHHGDASPGHFRMFFVLYFLMTGLHGVHMVIGIGVMLVLFVKAYRGGLLGDYASPVHVTGLYWHFVDIVWVFLFPLFYLVGVHRP